MFLPRILCIATVLSSCLLFVGCAANRSELSLTTQSTALDKAAIQTDANAPVAVLRSVVDQRVYEQAPRDPSTPSLGFEGADKASDELKARAIGRKRNGYGMAMGDLVLEEGDTVTSLVRAELEAALTQAGYRVVAEQDARAQADALIIDVEVKEFWTWLQPGFWSLKLHAKILTDLSISNQSQPVVTSVRTYESRSFATDDAWMSVIQKALNEYREKTSNHFALRSK